MFPPGYFATQYFAPEYFPPGQTTALLAPRDGFDAPKELRALTPMLFRQDVPALDRDLKELARQPTPESERPDIHERRARKKHVRRSSQDGGVKRWH